MEIWPGRPYPLGATFDGTGTNFAIFSEAAERVELCLIGERGGETRIPMPEVDAYVLALLPADGAAGSAVRLPGARAVRAAARVAVQPEQAAARPVRQGGFRRDRLGPGAVLLQHGRSGLAATTPIPART